MQTSFSFLSVMPSPKDAPNTLIARVLSESQAVAVSMRARGFKQAWYAAQLGKSEAYISQIANGKRPVPEWFVHPFCVLSGSNLLKQYRRLQAALNECERVQVSHLADLLRAA